MPGSTRRVESALSPDAERGVGNSYLVARDRFSQPMLETAMATRSAGYNMSRPDVS